jgi:hypothetical protein
MFVSKVALSKPYRDAGNELVGITPFMVGLEAQALIQYYEKYHDARILPMVRMAADVLYEGVTPLGAYVSGIRKRADFYMIRFGAAGVPMNLDLIC